MNGSDEIPARIQWATAPAAKHDQINNSLLLLVRSYEILDRTERYWHHGEVPKARRGKED